MMRHAQFIVLAVSLFALAACDESVPLGSGSSYATGLEDVVYARGDELISSKGKPNKDGGGDVATFTVEVFFDGSGDPAGVAPEVPAHDENTLEVTDLNLDVAFLNGVNGCSVSFDEASIDGPGRFFIYVSRNWVDARYRFTTTNGVTYRLDFAPDGEGLIDEQNDWLPTGLVSNSIRGNRLELKAGKGDKHWSVQRHDNAGFGNRGNQ